MSSPIFWNKISVIIFPKQFFYVISGVVANAVFYDCLFHVSSSFGALGKTRLRDNGPFLRNLIWAASKSAFEHAQNMRVHITLHICKVSSGIFSPLQHSLISYNNSICVGWFGPLLYAYARKHVFAWRVPVIIIVSKLCLEGTKN